MTQITKKYKNSDKFFGATDIISNFLARNLRDHTGLQVDFTNCFDCMVRDSASALAELCLYPHIFACCSSNTFRIAPTEIARESATLYSTAILGGDLQSNQEAQVLASTSVISANCPRDRSKNNSFSAAKSSMSCYADFATSFDCMVRDRFSKNASTNFGTGISKAIAIFSKVSRLGVYLPLNHLDQCLMSTCVRSCKSLYESSKNSSAFVTGSKTKALGLLRMLKIGFKSLIKKFSTRAKDSASSQINQAILSPSSLWNSLNLWWFSHLNTRLSVIPTYKSSPSSRLTKYIARELGSFLRCSKETEGSDRTSTRANWLPSPPTGAWHNTSMLPSILLIPSAASTCKLSPDPLSLLPSSLHSSFALPIFYSFFHLLRIVVIITLSDVYLMWRQCVTNIKYTQITKPLRQQGLVINQYPAKDGKNRPKLYEYTIRPKGRSPSPNFTMPSYAEMEAV